MNKELRIGNWVIDCDASIHAIASGYDIDGLWRPIPLTEEWLLKFGFKFNDYDSEDGEDGVIFQIYSFEVNENISYIVSLNSDGYNEFCINMVFAEVMINPDLRYVHQLQNLYFALTGQELTIIK